MRQLRNIIITLFVFAYLCQTFCSTTSQTQHLRSLQNDHSSSNLYPNPTSFDNSNAKFIYLVSQLPFGSKEKILNNTCGTVCNLIGKNVTVLEYVKYNYEGDDIGYVVSKSEEKKEIYFSFKGTDGIIQLMHEIVHNYYIPYSTEFFNKEDAKVMQYVQEAYLYNLHTSVIENLKKYATLQNDYKFVFSGYSLGGALATLAALDAVTSFIIHPKVDSPTLITYGCPRLANSVLSDYINSLIPTMFRVVNYNDVVAHLPPCSVIPGKACTKETKSHGYFLTGWHLRKEVWYYLPKDYDHYKECDNQNNEDLTCSDSFIFFSSSAHKTYYGFDHDKLIQEMK